MTQYLVCPPFAAKTARQRHLVLQISFLMTCNGILTHSARKARSKSHTLLTSWLSPDDLSGPIIAQWKRDPVILQDTATHWHYRCIKCSGYAWQCVDGHYHCWKSQSYVVALVFSCLQYKFIENTVGKEEIARNKQFLHFPHCFLLVWRAFCHLHQICNCRQQTLLVWKGEIFVVWERVKVADYKIQGWPNIYFLLIGLNRFRAVDRHCHKMRQKNKCGARFFHLAKVRGDNFLSSKLNSTYWFSSAISSTIYAS